jgi:hypothetical protein
MDDGKSKKKFEMAKLEEGYNILPDVLHVFEHVTAGRVGRTGWWRC